MADIRVQIMCGATRMAAIQDDQFVVLGLGAADIAALLAGHQMLVRLADLGLPDIRLLLLYGATQADIATVIERDLGLALPAIHPVNQWPM
jgi:hypothetical protein